MSPTWPSYVVPGLSQQEQLEQVDFYLISQASAAFFLPYLYALSVPWALPADIPTSPHIPAVLSSHSIYIRLLGTKAVIFFSFPSQLGGYYKLGWGRSQHDELMWRSSLTNAFLLHDFQLWGQGFYFIHLCQCTNTCRIHQFMLSLLYTWG